jgi:hypothetical protein
MSWLPKSHSQINSQDLQSVEMVIVPRVKDIGQFKVKRVLSFVKKRMVGPFIFWDQMGPGEFITGQGVDVRPHPHIGLSTLTYLFKGTLDHKDSLGNDLRIKPGELNLMTAGKGIVHSERTGQEIRQNPSTLFGIQSWIAQPKHHEYGEPNFVHFAKDTLPEFEEKGLKGKVILGHFEGVHSPVETQWDTLYVDLYLQAGEKIKIPKVYEERAVYVLWGDLEIVHICYDPQQMMVLRPGESITMYAKTEVRMILLGGAPMDGPRYIYWNFVASSKERLEEAKLDWKEGRFPTVPGDDQESIPLPD